LDLNPFAIYTTQGSYERMLLGVIADFNLNKKSKMIVGGSYRVNDAIIMMAGYEHELFYFTYSYDFGSSMISRNIYGLMTHEITIAYKMKSKF